FAHDFVAPEHPRAHFASSALRNVAVAYASSARERFDRPSKTRELLLGLRSRLRKSERFEGAHEPRQRCAALGRRLGHALKCSHRGLRLSITQEERSEGDRERPACGLAPYGRLENARRAKHVANALEELGRAHRLARALPHPRRIERLAGRLV